MSKRTKVWILAASFFIIVPAILLVLFGTNVINLVVVVSVIGLGIPIVTKQENDLIADDTIKLENGGSKTGNILAKLLVILIIVVIILLVLGNLATNT
jgi:hypothetical protein